ncbi:MAG: prepilin-type N-terminal cleavage/methylation domain-containing protein [Steroidobacteraceae bacterium]
MNLSHQRGFTLIEVIVALAIFALGITAIYGIFSEALQRTERARARDLQWLTAQSLQAALAVQSAPWAPLQSGVSPEGLRWAIDVRPFQSDIGPSGWRAYRVAIHVAPQGRSRGSIELDSIELARIRP